MVDIGFWMVCELLRFIQSLDSAKRSYEFHMDKRYWNMRNRKTDNNRTYSMREDG